MEGRDFLGPSEMRFPGPASSSVSLGDEEKSVVVLAVDSLSESLAGLPQAHRVGAVVRAFPLFALGGEVLRLGLLSFLALAAAP